MIDATDLRLAFEGAPEPFRSVLLRELDYDPATDPLLKDVIRVPLAGSFERADGTVTRWFGDPSGAQSPRGRRG